MFLGLDRQRLLLPPPGRRPGVPSGIDRHAEDPGPQVLDLAQVVLRPPAFEKGLLQAVTSVVPVSQQVVQRAENLPLTAREHTFQRLGRRAAGSLVGRCRLGHGAIPKSRRNGGEIVSWGFDAKTARMTNVQ